MEAMTTIHRSDYSTIRRLIEDIQVRLPHVEHHADRALLQRCLAVLTDIAVAPAGFAEAVKQRLVAAVNPEKVAERLGGGLDLQAAIEAATCNLGPYFRLVAAAKSVRCPRCYALASAPCADGRICDERTWAYAAQRRRDKSTLPRENVDIIRKTLQDGLETSAPQALAVAVKHGLVRLERVNGTEVQWVDAT